MILARIRVTGTCAVLTEWKEIPKGIRGAEVSIVYEDPTWDSLQKTVVFKGCVTRDVVTAGELVTIPPECVERAGAPLKIGIYGTDAGNNLAIPTLWADLGRVRDATDPSGDESTVEALPVWVQILALIGDLDDLATDAKATLVAAINEAATKGGGSVSEEEVWAIVDRYLQEHPPVFAETDPTVPNWAKQPQKPSYSAQEVGAEPAGTAAAAVSGHNTSADAHNDLRLELKAISNRLNAFLDSDDQTLDELSEIVACITSNKSLIDAITTSKVSVSDIVDNLATNVGHRPLSAAQGVVLKGLIDAVSRSLSGYQIKGDYALRSELPVKTSQLTNDSGFITKAVSDLANYYLKSETYTKDEVKALVSAIPKFSISVVQALPTQNVSATTIYLVPGGAGSDLYTEYIRVDNAWEILGAQRVDLTGYATEKWVEGKIPTKLPNPNALVINGKRYDGAETVIMNIEGTAAPNWLAKSGQPGHILFRPCYEAPEATLVDNVEVTSGYYTWINYEAVADYEKVTVVYDGTTYICPITFQESLSPGLGDESFFYIGNLNGDEPEYPFSIVGYRISDISSIVVGSGTHTLSVKLEAFVKKIDAKFLPHDDDGEQDSGEIVNWDILPKAKYTLSAEYASIDFEEVKSLVVGKTYIISIDGVEYEREAKFYEDDGWEETYIGRIYSGPAYETDDEFGFSTFDGGGGVFSMNLTYASKTIELGIREKTENSGTGDNGSSGGVSSWNDLTDKPFYPVIITPVFDGDMTGRETVFVQEGTYAVKVSSQSVSVSDMIGATAMVNMGGVEQTIPLTVENAVDATNVLGVPGAVVVMEGEPIVLSLPADATIQGAQFSAGTWFMCMVGQFHVKSLSCLAETVEKINPSCLPDGYPYVETIMVDPTFDGDMTGRETLKYANGLYFVKVTPQYVSIDEAIGATMVMDVGGEEQSTQLSADVVMDATFLLGVHGTIVGDGEIISIPEDISLEGVVLTAGTWFICGEGQFFVKSLSCLRAGKFEIITKMDIKFLPQIPEDSIPEYVMTENKYNARRTHWTDDDGTVHPLDRKYIPAEWIAAEVPTRFMFLPEITVTTDNKTAALEGAYGYVLTTLRKFDYSPVTEGLSVSVIYDGETYACKMERDRYYTIGNKLLIPRVDSNLDTGEPFGILILKGGGVILYTADTEPTEHTISIELLDAILPDPIPEEYLPESVDGVVIRSSTSGSTKKFRITVDDNGTISATEVT